MAHASTPDPQRTPTVLVVLVTHDAAIWLRDTLLALSAQSYQPLGILAVDDASTDGSREILEQALGSGRVLGLSSSVGIAGAVAAALDVPASKDAEYILILHDDTAMDPDCVARLVQAAVGIEGLERVGIVGPKVVDWFEPRLLREVGRSTDRFGHPSSPLQEGEIDQGQFDRLIEVLYVSSCAMLISRACLQRTGVPDERLGSHHEDLDLGWRARLAGFRVVMTPLARARHMAATARGDRPDHHARRERYYAERASLVAMLKHYRIRSLLFLLPILAAFDVVQVVGLSLARRFEDAGDLLAAWGWNVVHLPGTLRRRRAAQRVRRVPDRAIRRFMESAAVRLPRWLDTMGAILAEQRQIDREDEDAAPRVRLRHQTATLVRAHPVLVASIVGGLVAAMAFRDLFGQVSIQGAAVGLFPRSPTGFFRELISGVRTTGLGGTAAGSPALGIMGGLSTLLFASTRVAQKVLLAGLPLIAVVTTYRAIARQTGERLSAVVGGVAYGLSGMTLWAFSDGRIDALAAIAVMPSVMDRIESAFDGEDPGNRWRAVVALAIALGVGVSFFPGIATALLLAVGIRVMAAPSRRRGLWLTLGGAAGGAALVFPMLPGLTAGGAGALSSHVSTLDVHRIGRLALGPGPGTGLIAWFLPIAAVFGLSLAGGEVRGRALRAALTAVAGLGLAWASGAGYVPGPLSDPIAYLVLVASSEAMLVGYGLASVAGGVGRESFGWRQIGAAGLTSVLVVGIAMQSLIVMVGSWGWGGPGSIPAAFAVVANRVDRDFRVLWIGDDVGLGFPAPGGDPQGIFSAGPDSIRFAVTGRDGATILDTGRSLAGPGQDYLRSVLRDIVSGTTEHGGALLGPLGVRFVVADAREVPPGVRAALARQLDLDLVPAEGLLIYRNGHALPPAGLVSDPATVSIAATSSTAEIQRLRPGPVELATKVPGGWDAAATGPSTVLLATEDTSWRAEQADGGALPVMRSFGWATRIESPGGPVRVRYGEQWLRTAEVWLLGAMWAVALWVTRKPGSSR